MKRILMMAVLVATMMSAAAAGYNADQEALREGIESSLKSKGYSVERRDDGLMFMDSGDTYFIEIDKSANRPMYVRLVRYIKFNDKIKRSDVMKNLNEYNSTYTIKALCKEKNVILSAEMFVTKPEQFTYAFPKLQSLMKDVIAKIIK